MYLTKTIYTGAAFFRCSPSLGSDLNNDRLLYKLKTLITPTTVHELIKSYLTACCFKVRINDTIKIKIIKLINAGVCFKVQKFHC